AAAAIVISGLWACFYSPKTDDANVHKVLAEEAFREGMRLFLDSKQKAALERFSQAIKEDDKYALAYYYRGLVHDGLSRNDLAVNDFGKVIELGNPPTNYYDRYDPYRRRAYSRRLAGDLLGAVDDLDRAIELKSTEYELYEERGLVYILLKRYPEAR